MTRICLDGHNLALPKGTGIATYSRNLVHAYQKLGNETQLLLGGDVLGELSYARRKAILSGQAKPTYRYRKIWRALDKVVPLTGRINAPRRVGSTQTQDWPSNLPSGLELWHVNNLHSQANAHFKNTSRPLEIQLGSNTDIMHWTSPLPIHAQGCKNITTLHDIIPITHPHLTGTDPEQFRSIVQQCIDHSDLLISVSETTRQSVLDNFRIDPEKIVTSFQPVSLDFQRQPLALEEYDLKPHEYYVFAGALEPKKNLLRILDAYGEIKPSRPLVVIGHGGWDNEAEVQRLTDLSADRANTNVVWLPYLDRNTLLTLIENARAMLFVSLVEGFGLPAAEAITLGTPVIASDTAALREVCGNAAIYADPYDFGSIASAMQSLERSDDVLKKIKTETSFQAKLFAPEQHTLQLSKILGLIGY